MASASDAAPPLGGIAPLPWITTAATSSTPCLIRGANAALSPIFGAMAAWQPAQDLSYTALPSAAETCPAVISTAVAARIKIVRFIAFSFFYTVLQFGPFWPYATRLDYLTNAPRVIRLIRLLAQSSAAKVFMHNT